MLPCLGIIGMYKPCTVLIFYLYLLQRHKYSRFNMNAKAL